MKTIEVLQGQAGFNKIINGNFDIWQRGTSFAALANDAYSCDRYKYFKAGTVSQTISRSTDVPTLAESGYASSYSLDMTTNTGDASVATGDYVLLSQRVEGYNSLSLFGKTVAISFWVKSNITGTYCLTLNNSTSAAYISEYTINSADTWERKTIIIKHDDTVATWDKTNGTGIQIIFTLMIGSTYQGTADVWGPNVWGTSNQVNNVATSGNYFRISQVMLHEGKTALDTFVPSGRGLIQNELSLCQRYFWKADSFISCTNPNGTGWTGGNTIPFPVTMRATPAVTFGSNWSTGTGTIYELTKNKDVFIWRTYVSTVGAGNEVVAYVQTFEADAEL